MRVIAILALGCLMFSGCEKDPDIDGYLDREMEEIRGDNFFAEGDAMREEFDAKVDSH